MRVVARMRSLGKAYVVPRRDPAVGEEPFLDFNAGYVLRSVDQLPKQGDREPWRLKMNYFKDLLVFRAGVDDEALEYRDAAEVAVEQSA